MNWSGRRIIVACLLTVALGLLLCPPWHGVYDRTAGKSTRKVGNIAHFILRVAQKPKARTKPANKNVLKLDQSRLPRPPFHSSRWEEDSHMPRRRAGTTELWVARNDWVVC